MLNWKFVQDKTIVIDEDQEGADRYGIDHQRAEFLLVEFGKHNITYEFQNGRTMPENKKLNIAYNLCDNFSEFMFVSEIIFKGGGINQLLAKLEKTDLPLAAMITNLMHNKKDLRS